MTKRFLISQLQLPIAALGALASLSGCRGNLSDEPPVHLQRNMFTQDKAKPQRENTFFEDGRAMRPYVEGTVAVSAPLELTAFYTGKLDTGEFAKKWPAEVKVTMEFLQRGQERYNIYCAPCHDRTGSGNGAVIQRAKRTVLWQPTSYFEERILNMPVGELFHTITHGVRTMPAYAYQVPISDRWAIVAYVRALQRSQHARLADVPPAVKDNLI